MPNKDDVQKAESLAANLARGMSTPQWLLNNNGQFKVVRKPVFPHLGLEVLKEWLLKIGISFEGEFDTTGKRVL